MKNTKERNNKMKITKKQLRQIIKEELEKVITEFEQDTTKIVKPGCKKSELEARNICADAGLMDDGDCIGFYMGCA